MDYNLTKGKVIFWDTIKKELDNFSVEEQNRIQDIAKGFENSVAIMPDELNNIYAAKRLANAIIEVGSKEENSNEINIITSLVLNKYNQSIPTAAINKNHFVPEDSSSISGKFGKFKTGDADEFEKELRSFSESEIDLLDDLSNLELSTEGLRKKLIIPSNFNQDNDRLPEISDDSKSLGTIVFNKDGEIEKVLCPSCEKSDVYFISHDKFGCFICNDEFFVPMEMGDSLK